VTIQLTISVSMSITITYHVSVS